MLSIILAHDEKMLEKRRSGRLDSKEMFFLSQEPIKAFSMRLLSTEEGRESQWLELAVFLVLLVWPVNGPDTSRHRGRGGFKRAAQPRGSAKQGTSLCPLLCLLLLLSLGPAVRVSALLSPNGELMNVHDFSPAACSALWGMGLSLPPLCVGTVLEGGCPRLLSG